jgi:hypothetical protein
MFRLAAILSLIVAAKAFAPVRSNMQSVRLFAEKQTVGDLNLEEMFEVFEEADRTVKDAPKSKPAPTSTFNPKNAVGSSAPLKFFDPLGFSYNIDEDSYKLYQEAETKHGRVAMLAFVGLVVGEISGGPIFKGEITGPAIYQFQQADDILPSFWVSVLFLIGLVEGNTIINNWQPASETAKDPNGVARLNKDTVPGDLKFDPAGLKPSDPAKYASIKTKELNNGRLAMIGVVGFIGQELVTNQAIF